MEPTTLFSALRVTWPLAGLVSGGHWITRECDEEAMFKLAEYITDMYKTFSIHFIASLTGELPSALCQISRCLHLDQ